VGLCYKLGSCLSDQLRSDHGWLAVPPKLSIQRALEGYIPVFGPHLRTEEGGGGRGGIKLGFRV
jgi:hypothetical protein